ncbi:hypothetical protein HXX76_008063 [Chlamydomonas incerta]|uniref:Secreted protein n=1 Tax=Chlamydomonas incerta TaxID=51695 RepID=A0A835W1F5_CHLIN|nr:hypothetical protein HXX76_008063 [Chlamydomonas incerta]|eukprot:KAG2433693.1 hypothetical protein HXX76_008063 [Chlamydomonas incerta]
MAWVAALFSFWIAFVCIVDVVHCLAGCCGDWNKAYANEKAERDAKAHHGQPCNQEMNRDEAQKAAAV